MRVSARSYLMAGVAALAAGTVAIPPSITPPATAATPVHAQVRLAAETRTVSAPKPVIALIPKEPAGRTAKVPIAAAASPTVAGPAVAPVTASTAPRAAALALPGLSNAIIDGYDWAIGWVDYGVDLAQYAVGWIPVANIFAPQIGIFYYDLIRPIITSAVYNTAYLIGGQVDLIQGISNVVNDSIAAGRGFIQAEINWALSWLPPLPPLPFAATATSATATTMAKTTAVSLTANAEPTDGKAPVTAEQQTTGTVADETKPAEPAPADTPTTPAPTTAPEQPADTTTPVTTPDVKKDAETATDVATDSGKPEKPATTKPDTQAPDTQTSDTAKSDSKDPDTKAPDSKAPGSKDDTPKSDATKSDTSKPATTKSDTSKPATTKPDTSKPDTKKPRTEHDRNQNAPGQQSHQAGTVKHTTPQRDSGKQESRKQESGGSSGASGGES